jgi:hypothetical protein
MATNLVEPLSFPKALVELGWKIPAVSNTLRVSAERYELKYVRD